MATKIGTLQNPEKTEALLPRTCLKAVADKNGDYISEDVLASDINALKDGAIEALSDQSSTEVLVGKTYDNYPIYRIHFHGTLTNNTYTSITSAYNSTNNRLIRAEGQLGGVGGYCINVNCYLNDNYFSGMYLNPYGVQIYYSDEFKNKDYDIDLFIAKLN